MYKKLLTAISIATICSGTSVAQQVNLPSSAMPMVATSTPITATNAMEVLKPISIAQDIVYKASLKPAKQLSTTTANTQLVVSHPGATFIKVHFSYFNIPEGAYVTVSDATGNESYIYNGQNNQKMTFNSVAGENGQTQFAAMSVFGDKAIVKLTLPANTQWNQQHGIKIDSFKAGNDNSDQVFEGVNQNSPQPHSTCGVNERRDVACWENSHPVEFERTRPVARLLMNGNGLCTGWRVGNDNHMFTNNHCVGSATELTNTEVWFNYQATTCNGTVDNSQIVKVTGKDLLKTDYLLDYTLFTVNDFADIQSFGNFGLDVRTPVQGERIYIAQHGSGNPKELAIESDQNANGLCQIDVAIEDGRGTDTDTGYYCDTIGGSSGSPVLAAATNRVVALHHFGGCTNQGTRLDLIWPQVATYFGNEVPVGDGPDGGPIGNLPPVAQIAETCNLLTCQLDGSGSTDYEGSIVSYEWSISDGAIYTGANISHTFAENGNYSVTLTVTDDEGATGSKTKMINANDGTGFVLESGVPVTDLFGARGADQVWTIETTEDNTTTTVVMSGGTGDADLYVKRGTVPTDTSYDCRPYASGNNETCTVTSGTPNTVYVRIKGYSSFSGVQLVATNTITIPGDGYPKTNLSGVNRQMDLHSYTANSTGNVTVTISGGSGDADLYVRVGAVPTTSAYDCRPYRSGNNESCTVGVTAGEIVHIGIRAYSNYSGVTLNVTEN